MLIDLVTQQPDVILTILRRTPVWVWGLLTAFVALGMRQMRDRSASLAQVCLLPLGMTLFSAGGALSMLSPSPLLEAGIGIWVAAAVLLFVIVAPGNSGARYDAVRRIYVLPGSLVPLALIVGIFLVKYGVGVELAMAPHRMREPQYALTVAGLFGAFTGMFVGRTARLWRLARAAPTAVTA